jgi:ABC-type branched-subunit amino acid transport system ATPase component/ABC-type branched-subunit amino acid transport system permease subunit
VDLTRLRRPRADSRASGGVTRRNTRNYEAMIVIIVVAALIPLLSSNAAELARYEDVLIDLLVVIGLNVSFGYAGVISLGQPVIAGAAAYMAGVLSVTENYSAWVTLPFAVVTGVVFAIVLNSVSFRLTGWYLAATTFFAVLVFPNLIDVFQRWTQGDNGLGGISPIPGAAIGFAGNSVREYEIVLAITAVVFLATANLVTSRWGLMLESLRDCHNGLIASGGSLTTLRFTVTIVSAIPVALAGWLTAHVGMFLVPTSFGLNQLLLYAGAVILGGRGTIWGPVVGTVVFEGISLWIGPFSVNNELVLGVSVLVISAVSPVGLSGTAVWVYTWSRARWARYRQGRISAPGPASLADGPSAIPVAAETDSEVAVASLAPKLTRDTVVLEARGLTKSFGGLQALSGVDLELRSGRITGLVGPNGSGKTTLLNVVTGFVSPDSGRVTVLGVDVTRMPAHEIARRGVRRSFQTPQLVPTLSLADNLAVGLIAGGRQHLVSSILRGRAYRRATKEIRDTIESVCGLLGFDQVQAATPVGELSLGHRRIAEIGRALVARPTVLCLDEPAAGLGDDEIEASYRALKRLAGMGFSILLIEHNLKFVQSVSDAIVCLESGRVVDAAENGLLLRPVGRIEPASGKVTAGSDLRLPIAATERLETAPNPQSGVARVSSPVVADTAAPDAILRVESLSAWYGEARALFDLSLSVRRGSVAVVLGDNGAGKSTLLRSLARVHRKTRGSVLFADHELSHLASHQVADLGLGLVREGAIVFPDMTVAEHLGLSRRLAERRHQEWRGEDAVYEWLPILAERRNAKAGLLSGGQRQLLALASAASASPTCLLLDEPSAGLAESLLETVFDFIRRIATEGITLVVAEQSDRWISEMADDIYWLEVGRLVAESQPRLEPTKSL